VLFAASCGVLFAVFLVAGFALRDTGASSSDVSAAEVLSSYSDSDTEHRREIGATFVGFAVFFLLVFLGTLRRALAAAEGNSRLFSSSAAHCVSGSRG
jgi:hypothetical protein